MSFFNLPNPAVFPGWYVVCLWTVLKCEKIRTGSGVGIFVSCRVKWKRNNNLRDLGDRERLEGCFDLNDAQFENPLPSQGRCLEATFDLW
jgi:hypothetical protein